MTTHLRTAEQRRADIRNNAQKLGMDDDFISELVETFYQRVRADDRINHLFDPIIGDDWDAHLAKMKDFWASVALDTKKYSGKTVPAHLKLTETRPEHFEIWLELFRKTLEDTAPTQEAIPFFMQRAERIASSLQLAMFGVPGFPGSKW